MHFSYIDQESMEEHFFGVPEQGGGSLIPDGPLKPGVLQTVAHGSEGHWGYIGWKPRRRLAMASSRLSLGSNAQAKEAFKVAFDYFKANAAVLAPAQRQAITTTTCTWSSCTTLARPKR